jgi:magnesium-transporting ATPase (P-type)
MNAIKFDFPIIVIREALSNFIISFTIIAYAVTEELSSAVMISLAYSMRQMITDNKFVRHLNDFETMENVTVICPGKTKPLTKNLMIIWKKLIRVKKIKLEDQGLHWILRSIAMNFTADLQIFHQLVLELCAFFFHFLKA